MLLDQIKNSINIHLNMICGLVWSNMVYHIIIISIHDILSTRPLDQYIYIITCEETYQTKLRKLCILSFRNIIYPYIVYLEKWSSGLESLLLSKMQDRARPTMSTAPDTLWSSSLDSITGGRLCH